MWDFDNIPKGADMDVRTFLEWFLLVPELSFDDKGQTRQMSLSEIEHRLKYLFYKSMAISIWLSVLMAYQHNQFRIDVLPGGITLSSSLALELLNGYAHTWWIYSWASFCLDFSVIMCLLFTGGKAMEAGFDNPLLASRSVRQVWGTRWNLPVQALLQRTCYVPIRRQWGCSRGLAAVGTFGVSGLLHEYNFATHNWVAYQPGIPTLFFLGMGCLLVLEDWVSQKDLFQPLCPLWQAISAPVISMGVMLVSAIPVERYFIRSWLDAGMVESVSHLFPYVKCQHY